MHLTSHTKFWIIISNVLNLLSEDKKYDNLYGFEIEHEIDYISLNFSKKFYKKEKKNQKNSPGRNRTSFLGLLDPCPNQCTTRDYIYYLHIILMYFCFIRILLLMSKVYMKLKVSLQSIHFTLNWTFLL